MKSTEALEAENRVQDGHGLAIEAWRLKMKPWRVYRPAVADSHYSDEEQDPDPHLSDADWSSVPALV